MNYELNFMNTFNGDGGGLLGVNGIVPEEAKSYSFGRIQSIWAESVLFYFGGKPYFLIGRVQLSL
jgi:hypothetical protein